MAVLRNNGVEIARITGPKGSVLRFFQSGKLLRRRPNGGYKVIRKMKASATYGAVIDAYKAAGFTIELYVPEHVLDKKRVPVKRGRISHYYLNNKR